MIVSAIDISIYCRDPLTFRNHIPVFSSSNNYTENYERISQDHLSAVAKSGDNPFIPESLWAEMEESTSNLIAKYSKAGEKILDAGVGLGRLLEKFPQLDRYGMDISFDYLEKANALGINCCYALIEDMPYKENFFDIIVCTDVLEHVLDLNASLTSILKVLKPRGTLIIRVPYRENLENYMSVKVPYEFVHLRNFDENVLQLLFTKIFKCEVIEWSTAGTLNVFPHLKNSFPSGRLLRSLTYRYYMFLKTFFPEKYDTLFYKTEINIVVKKRQAA